jgi:signal recognition particle subunit SRP54
MFENLSTRLQKTLRDLKGEGRISEHHVQEVMRDIRMALLEADVNFKVVRDFVADVKDKALGEDVLKSLSPGQQVVKIVKDELVHLLGDEPEAISFSKVSPSCLMMIGLQGSGKTTSTGKLASWLSKNGKRPLMLSVDVYRPAAIKQLEVIGKAIGLPVFECSDMDPVERVKQALRHCRNTGYDVLMVDTAGRLHIDDDLMAELERIRELTNPSEILLVSDAMTGQDAVNSASEFNRRMKLTGIIMTKMDGDARGGAALSIKSVTGTPIKFVGTGEKYEALEIFHPDRLAGRILGMGDVLSLIEKAEDVADEEQAMEMLKKIRRNEFSLEDFRNQLKQIRRLGPLDQIIGMLPKMGPLKGLGDVNIDEKQFAYLEAIINSMTTRERLNYKILNGSRRKRIAMGSGRPVSEVNRLIKQYMQTKKMMQKFSKGTKGKKLPGLNW